MANVKNNPVGEGAASDVVVWRDIGQDGNPSPDTPVWIWNGYGVYLATYNFPLMEWQDAFKETCRYTNVVAWSPLPVPGAPKKHVAWEAT